MPKIVFTESEKQMLEVLDRRPLLQDVLVGVLNMEFVPQPREGILRTVSALKSVGYIEGGGVASGPSAKLRLTRKGVRAVERDFEGELEDNPGHSQDDEEALLSSQAGVRRQRFQVGNA